MRIVTSRSKYLTLAVFCCSLLIAWNGISTDLTDFGFSKNAYVHRSGSFIPQDSIWRSISRELNLDHKTNSPRVQSEIRKLLADQGKLYQILKAATPYIYFIHKQTQVRKLPAELALIPVIESEFSPGDHSKKGALGLWQLMPQTARDLGVKVNKSGYDGRRNVVASTKAALAFFNDLGNNFNGNWYLAIAAYNCGPGRVESAERRAGSHNFWDLPLPKETKLYVPKLLAVAAIVKNPERYGVQLPHITNQPYFAEIKVEKPQNLVQAAQSLGTSVKELHKLNPDYKNHKTPLKKGVTLLIPVNKIPAKPIQLALKETRKK